MTFTIWHFVYPILFYSWGKLSLVLNDRASQLPHHYHVGWPQIDNLIPFVPQFAVFYFSAFVLGNLGYFLLFFDDDFAKAMIGQFVIFWIGLGFYYFFPCKVVRKEQMTADTVSKRWLLGFQSFSKPYNSFPSMHCTFCLYSALVVYFYGNGWLGGTLLVWFLLVMLSTLFTKQHHILDVLAGVALAGTIFFLTLFF